MSNTHRVLAFVSLLALPASAVAQLPRGTTPPTAAQLAAQDAPASKPGTTFAMGSAESTTTVTFDVDADGVVTGFTARSDESERESRTVK